MMSSVAATMEDGTPTSKMIIRQVTLPDRSGQIQSSLSITAN